MDVYLCKNLASRAALFSGLRSLGKIPHFPVRKGKANESEAAKTA